MQPISKLALSSASAYQFIILLGITSLFADATYESARSINGQYLQLLGANATTIGIVAGFGELVGYAIRMVSGFVAERTGRYWAITIFGYLVNLFSVPLLALAGYWQIAALLIVLERLGKAIRTPARDAMLSHAGHKVGFGWAFGLHDALDRFGAMFGPLLIAALLYKRYNYQFCFSVLAIPAVLSITALLIARKYFPQPRQLEVTNAEIKIKKFSTNYWWYLIAAACIAAGFADFSLIAYHFSKTHMFPVEIIPIAYAGSMGISALLGPLLGRMYDHFGFKVIFFISIPIIAFAPLVFLGSKIDALLGVILWSVGMVAHESLMRAVIANMTSPDKRASAYGIFNLGYGVAWFIGSAILGVLYDHSITYMVIFSVAIQVCALPLLAVVMFRKS